MNGSRSAMRVDSGCSGCLTRSRAGLRIPASIMASRTFGVRRRCGPGWSWGLVCDVFMIDRAHPPRSGTRVRRGGYWQEKNAMLVRNANKIKAHPREAYRSLAGTSCFGPSTRALKSQPHAGVSVLEHSRCEWKTLRVPLAYRAPSYEPRTKKDCAS